MSKNQYLALDFGAESGRALLGELDGGGLQLHEIHRWPNEPVKVMGHVHWDILRLFHEIKRGLHKALGQTGGKLDGIGVDTWGVDFGLLCEDGELLGNPFQYRDSRTNGVPEKLFAKVPWEEVFRQTGIQFMQINTVYQLYSMALADSPALKQASQLLMVPDIFNYWLTGRKVSEFSIASTTQFYNPTTRTWAYDLLRQLGLPTGILPEIVDPGTIIGNLESDLAAEMGATEAIKVIAPATHDTGSAVAAVPAQGSDYIYISSGTWSLMGLELSSPAVTDEARNANFTNEGGVCGTIRFLKNIMGLWIVQECRRAWQKEGKEYSYAELTSMAAASPGFVSLVNPNAAVFLPAGEMPARIRKYCSETGQTVPESPGAIVRCALDSLALIYRETAEALDTFKGMTVPTIHIVGGGTQNKLLCQLTANATRRTVIAGPVEATAMGNVLVQAMGTGAIGSLQEAREVVRQSCEPETYHPVEDKAIDKAYALFRQLPG